MKNVGGSVVLALGLAVMASPGVARAEAQDTGPGDGGEVTRWSFETGYQHRWLGSGSAAVLGTQALGGMNLTVGRRLLAVPVARRAVDVRATLTATGGEAEGQIFQRLDTRVAQAAYLVGVEARAPVWRGLMGRAQLQAGPASTTLSLDDGVMRDHAWAPVARLGLGVATPTLNLGRVGLGLGIDAGYVLAASPTVHAQAESALDPELMLETESASLGKLDTSGFDVTVALRLSLD